MLTIHHSPNARSVRLIWLCEEMGVPYTTVKASFVKPSPVFLALNPLRTVPVLQDGEVTMIESIAMMLYVMGKYGPTDLEVKPNEAGYAEYLQFLMFGEAGLAAYGNPLVGTRYVAPDDQKQNWTATYLKTTLQKRLAFLGERIAGRPFVAAGRFTAADISVAYIANGAKFAGIDDDIPPAVRAYIDALHQRPAYQRAAAVA